MGSRLHGNDGGRRRTSHGTAGGRRRAHIVIPATAGIHGGVSLRWVPVYTGTTEAPTSSFPRRRESTAGGEPAMGSRLHGNDGGRRRTSHGRRRRAHIVIPATAGGGAPHIVIPATAGIHGGGRRDGFPSPRERRRTTAPPRTSHRHCRDGGNPRRGGDRDGFPSTRERRHPTAPHIVIAATAGIHGGGRAGDGFPSPRERRWAGAHPTRYPHRHCRDGGNPRRGESLRWVPVYTGTTEAPTSSFPRRRESTAWGACDGFPSPRERR